MINNKYGCGLMVHSLYDENTIAFQGAININEFESIIKSLRSKIVDAGDFLRCNNKNKMCVTFDDGLLNQYELALPILNKYNIKAFWFVSGYSLEDFDGISDQLVQKFILTYFNSFNDFYNEFFKIKKVKDILELFDDNYLKKYSIYTSFDRRYRFVRNLYKKEFNCIIREMIKKYCDIGQLNNNIFIGKDNVKKLYKNDHEIGLHSYTHNPNMRTISFKDKVKEYSDNKNALEQMSVKPNSMSHPYGEYDKENIKILQELGIKIGFCNKNNGNTQYEISRIDIIEMVK